jgi:AcrR family transcriptional regulator
MLAAITDVSRERGAGNVTVAHVVARSGVSRRTFYELFEDREDCFLAALDHAIARGAEGVVPAWQSGGRWRERVRRALAALLEFLDEEPGMGSLCIVDALSAGPVALERRAVVLGLLIDAVHEGRTEARSGRSGRGPTRLVAEGVVGAVLSVIHARLSGEEPGGLSALLNPLMGMIVLPYLGPAASERELERPAPTPRRTARPQSDPLRDLDMRLTYRTVRVLVAVASEPRASNRLIANASGIADQGQISKLLHRLQTLGLVQNTGGDHAKGEPNAWSLTAKGEEVEQIIRAQTGDGG